MHQDLKQVKEFSEKFKQFVANLKELALANGCSLEEAQKFMTSQNSPSQNGIVE